MKDIVFITVQYNNPADTDIFLSSFRRIAGVPGCAVIVVDNSDKISSSRTDGGVTDLDIHEMRPPTNLYYWGGAAFALDAFYGASGPWPKWVVVCNNDIEIASEDFLEKLRGFDGTTHPIIAPSIVSQATGKDQNPILETSPSWLKRTKWRLYDLSYPLAKSLLAIQAAGRRFRTFRGTAPHARSSPVPRRIYAPHGACMIFSSEFFERGGKLDTTVPLFAEELTVAALAEKVGMPVWYCPALRISHREHSTTGLKLTRSKYEMERMARRRYYELAD